MNPPAHAPPAGLAVFQNEFAGLLRTPLSTASGTFCPDESGYPRAVLRHVLDVPHSSSAARLAVYHRQYWFRLFTAMQGTFPLLSRLMGLFSFNRLCQLYLTEHPPRSADLDCVSDTFAIWFQASPTVPQRLHAHAPAAALDQALRLDATWHQVWNAPSAPVWRPSGSDASTLADARLVLAPTVAFVEFDWPLLDVRKLATQANAAEVLTLPARLKHRQYWAIFRNDAAIASWPLERSQYLLYRECSRSRLRSAIARLEQTCTSAERAKLSKSTRGWLARSVELGFWTGVAATDAGPSGEER